MNSSWVTSLYRDSAFGQVLLFISRLREFSSDQPAPSVMFSTYRGIKTLFVSLLVHREPQQIFIAVTIWAVTGQGFENTKWPAVLYYQ